MRAKVLLHSFDEKFKAFAYFNVVDLGEGFNPGFISEKRKRIRIRHNKITKGGVAVTGFLKILALPKRGGGSDPCQDFVGGFVQCSY